MMTRISFTPLAAAAKNCTQKQWQRAVLLACTLAALPVAAAHAAPAHTSSSTQLISGLNGHVRLLVPHGPVDLRIVPADPQRVPQGLVAVPHTGFQVIGNTRRSFRDAYVSVSMTAGNYADTAVYRQGRGQWQRLPTSQRFRSGRTLSMSARLYRLRSGARYAVLARHRPARPLRTRAR